MGRTRRKRSHKKPRTYCACDLNEDVVLLNRWLSENGVRKNEKLSLAVFDNTGRGVLTKAKINAGEELINLPLNLTINVTTLLMDLPFCNIFLSNEMQCLLKYKNSVSFQALMAFYLTYLKSQGDGTKWATYVESLPREYTVPYFLPSEVKCSIDANILSVISKQSDIIESSFTIFENILRNNLCHDGKSDNFKKIFTKSIYEWAYFTVNTRCVYMDLSKLIDLRNVEGTILILISDNTNISLCPYLDMINHSVHARNETQLIVSNNIDNVAVKNVNSDLFCDVRFSIYTKNSFDPYTEVFICYGDSHNLKLITEYGFFLPSNELDYVPFTFEDVYNFLELNSCKLSQDQISFVTSHGLNKDLYIDNRGLSYNFYGLLMVVKYYYNHGTDVSKLLYSAAICVTDNSLNNIIMPMVRDKCESIQVSINRLKLYENQCVILSNCIELMCQYVSILEKFIKC